MKFPALLWIVFVMAAAPTFAEVQAPSGSSGGSSGSSGRAASSSAADGFTRRGRQVVMTRRGVTTVVKHEIVLRNGLHVMPDGSVILPDGGRSALHANQILTFAGVIQDLPSGGTLAAARSVVGPYHNFRQDVGFSSRDGITVDGPDTFITRNGVTEKMTREVRLPNGTLARPDGTVVLANGEKITLRPDQLVDLKGRLREAPVKPNASPVDPSTNPAR